MNRLMRLSRVQKPYLETHESDGYRLGVSKRCMGRVLGSRFYDI